jgi:hypothetical protein
MAKKSVTKKRQTKSSSSKKATPKVSKVKLTTLEKKTIQSIHDMQDASVNLMIALMETDAALNGKIRPQTKRKVQKMLKLMHGEK